MIRVKYEVFHMDYAVRYDHSIESLESQDTTHICRSAVTGHMGDVQQRRVK